MREHFVSKDDLKPVRREELLDQVRSGEMMVIDVRSASEYRSGHIQGGNIPLENLPERLAKLPKDQEIGGLLPARLRGGGAATRAGLSCAAPGRRIPWMEGWALPGWRECR